jgi:hypothetical protein
MASVGRRRGIAATAIALVQVSEFTPLLFTGHCRAWVLACWVVPWWARVLGFERRGFGRALRIVARVVRACLWVC